MIYNDDLFIKLQKGWDEPKEGEVNWDCVMINISKLIDCGIQPMLNDLLGINHGGKIPDKKYVRILDPENFVRVVSLDKDYKSVVEDFLDTLDSKTLIKTYEKEYGNNACCTDDFMEGIALFGYQIIREDTSMKSLALHLICHEMMHTIANQDTVNQLRTAEDSMGDEAINEFFARLATQYLIASKEVCPTICGITTTQQMKDDKRHNRDHNEWGTYGKRISTSSDICTVLNSADKLAALKSLARFYFLGEERPQ